MSSSLAPFLYQTRTIQRAWMRCPAPVFVRHAHANRARPYKPGYEQSSQSVPFDWEAHGEEPPDSPPKYLQGRPTPSGINHKTLQKDSKLTLSPNEAHVFKRIFEEIAEGKMPRSRIRKRNSAADKLMGVPTQPQSVVETARMSAFRDKYLERFPESLRNAASKALGLFELQPSESDMEQMSEEDKSLWAERLKFREMREAEKTRVEKLMMNSKTDFELWEVLEREVFSLPDRLGLRSPPQPEPARPNRKKSGSRENKEEEAMAQAMTTTTAIPGTDKSEKLVMDVHGALYPNFLTLGLKLLDTAFARPSPFAFQILAHIKSLGLESYVLGVSTPFYTSLANMHWDRCGDAASALDTIQEMNSTGLYADEAVSDLLTRIREHLTSCSLGQQGPFVSAIVESPPYDGALIQRLDEVEAWARYSMEQHRRHFGS